MKTCTKCDVAKPVESFNWKKKGVQRSAICKDCHKEYRKAHYNSNRNKYIAKARAWELASGGKIFLRYGLTDEALQAMMDKYQGMCWLCRKKPAVHIDHDHTCCSIRSQQTCGKCIRGVLCSGCNTGLGQLGDSLEGLERATLYLQQHEQSKG